MQTSPPLFAQQETIVAAAIKVGKMTISAPPPARHHRWNYNRKTVVQPSGQGFLTSAGRFVGREEALKLALAAGQLLKPNFQPDQLFSEDLW